MPHTSVIPNKKTICNGLASPKTKSFSMSKLNCGNNIKSNNTLTIVAINARIKASEINWKMFFPDDEKPIHEPLTDNKNVAGITIVTILGIMVFVVIALICYAQKNTVSSTKQY